MWSYLFMTTLFYTTVCRQLYALSPQRTFDDCVRCNRKLSMLHLSACIPLASYAMYTAPCVWCIDAIFHRQHWLYDITLMNTTGYFIVELIVLFRNWFKYNEIDGGVLMIFHHGLSFTTYYISYNVMMGQHIETLFLLNEVSTVFLNGIYFWSHRPRLRLIPGIGLIITFFVFRILMFFRISYIFVRNWSVIAEMPFYFVANLGFVTVFFSIMNCYWFGKILSGFRKAISNMH